MFDLFTPVFMDLVLQTPMVAVGFLALAPFLATAIAGIAGAGATIYGAKKASSAADRASRQQIEASDRALALERERDARDFAEAQRIDALNRETWMREVQREQANMDRMFNEDVHRDRRREPYRAAGRAALADLDKRRQGSMADLMPVGRI